MAYVSSWRRDGASTGIGGARRRVADAVAVCIIPGCGRSAGPHGDTCAGCRVAYAGAIAVDAVDAVATRIECWLCGGVVPGLGASCSDCGPVTHRSGVPMAAPLFGSAREVPAMRMYRATTA